MGNVVALNGFGKKIDFVGVMCMVVEQMGLSQDVKENIKQELYYIKQGSALACKLDKDIEELRIVNESTNERLKKAEEFAECLYNNASVKRDFCSHVNSLAYRITGGSVEIKDQLFHGILTKNCKANVCKELNASCEGRIKVADLELAKKAATKYLTPFEANRIIHETVKRWESQIAKGSVRKTLNVEMLNKYIEQENERVLKDMEDRMNEI